MTLNYSLPSLSQILGVLVLAATLFAVMRRWVFVRRFNLPLPPGPSRLPIIGNLLDIPMQNMELHFRDMSTQYGMCLFHQPLAILNN